MTMSVDKSQPSGTRTGQTGPMTPDSSTDKGGGHNRTLIVVGLFAMVCLIWGTTWIAIKMAVTDMPPMLASGLRFLIAVPVFAVACRRLRTPMRYPPHLRWFFWFITLCYFAIPFFLYNYGEQVISSGLTAICFGSVSVLMVLFGVPILGARISALQLTCIVGAFAALTVLVARTQEITAASGWGIGAVVFAATLHALAYVMIKKYGSAIHTLTLNTVPMLAAGAGLTTASLLFERPGLDVFTTRSVVATLYLGVVASVIGFGVYFSLVQRLDTLVVSFVFVLFPIVAQVFSYFIEKTSFGPTECCLTIVILGAFAVTLFDQRSAATRKAAP